MALKPADYAILDQAADELKREAVRLQARMQLADVLERLGPIGRAIQDSENRLTVARQEEEKAAAALAVAKKGIDQAREAGANIIAQARGDAETLTDVAKTAANKTAADAQAKANKRIADAEAKASDIEGKVTARQADLDAINAAIAKAEDERARIETARATALASLGG